MVEPKKATGRLTEKARRFLDLYRVHGKDIGLPEFCTQYGFGKGAPARWSRECRGFRREYEAIKEQHDVPLFVSKGSPRPALQVENAELLTWQLEFLKAWKATGERGQACRLAGKRVSDIVKSVREDENFRHAYDEMREEMAWELEDKLFTAGREGKVNAQIRFLEKHHAGWAKKDTGHGNKAEQKRFSEDMQTKAAKMLEQWRKSN